MIQADPITNLISKKERKQIRDQKIRALYQVYKNLDRVVLEMRALGMGVSKTTVFFAVNGRSKKSVEKRKIRKTLHNKNKHNNKQ